MPNLLPIPAPPTPSFKAMVLAAGLIVGAALITYHNCFSVPLIFDDSAAITNNPSIRALRSIGAVFTPPVDCTTAGRPLANLSFALNYAWGGFAVEGYHVVNLLLHILAGLTLFGVIRRTLRQLARTAVTGSIVHRLSKESLTIALVAALLWSVHPLLTESVTYISQRTEVLMGLCYLLTLYLFIRGIETSPSLWWPLSVSACVAGMMSKEGMVTAPVLVFVYDRLFVAGSSRLFERARWLYYLALALSWLVLGVLMTGLKYRSVGFSLGVTWWKYALTECEAIVRYLTLLLWPHPLVFDYGVMFAGNDILSAFYAAAIAVVLAVVILVLWRWPRFGFLIAVFFLILSPTSSIVPVSAQPIAENRVYLASAALLTALVIGLFHLLGRRAWLFCCGTLSVACVTLAVARNAVYLDSAVLWSDTVSRRPTNPRAYENLGEVLLARGDIDSATHCFEAALTLKPDYALAHNNYATILHDRGQKIAAREQIELALRFQPNLVEAHENLSRVLFELGDIAGSDVHAREALRLKPDFPEARNNLGNALLAQGRFDEARDHYAEAVRLKPDFPQAQMNLGVALRQLGQLKPAQARFERAIRLRPDFSEAHFNLGAVLRQIGEFETAVRELETALRLKPDFPEAHNNLGAVLLQQGQRAEARRHFEEALRLRPDYPDARTNLARVPEAH